MAALILAAPVQADETPSSTEPPKAPASGPSLELLDFIGSWTDDDGEWIDPADMATLPPSGKERKDDETD